MKRFLALAIALITILSLYTPTAFAEDEDAYSNLYFFGHYPMDAEKDYYGDQAIGWWILKDDIQEEKALLISFYAIDYQAYDESTSTWKDSSIRQWLNNDFYEAAFTDEEKQFILTTNVKNGTSENYIDWNESGGEDTQDKVFLLSAAECLEYLPDRSKCYYTPYAQDMDGKLIKGKTGPYWLRSPGKKAGEAAVFDDGKIHSRATKKATGVCPAIWVDYSKDMSSLPFEKFVRAIELEDDYGEYLKAYEIYDSLGTYEYSYYFAAQSLLEYALEANDNDEEMAQRLQRYRQYCIDHDIEIDEESLNVSSYDLLNEKYYNLAVRFQENGEYQRAIDLYTKIGSYSDAMDRLLECYDKCGVRYTFIDAKPVNAGKKGNNYSETIPITDKDIENGCKIGDFVISGYTEMENDNGDITFIKTRDHGIDMVLWFDIDRDIDDLTGDGKLSILADPKGWDAILQAPEVGKCDFGRGTLLVQHFKEGEKPRTVQYKNYLAAKETGTANTAVEIKEEGTYRIALDYMIKNSDLKHVFNSTSCYRVSFSFKVKNGSGMAFIFDSATGSEMEDYTRAEQGFTINSARSTAVKINYIRYGINQNGNALDVRKTESASNGQTLSDHGYYIVTMTNRETGISIEKHFFVGTEEELLEYIEVDSSLKKFA